MISKVTRWVGVLMFGVVLLGSSTPVKADSGRNEHLFSPLVINAYMPAPALDWDARLTQRGAYLIPATVSPGQGYWRLLWAHWYDPEEAAGKHHIFVDVLDATDQRQVGIPVIFSWDNDSYTAPTEPKPDEPYAVNFPMYAIAPAYSAHPADGAPADAVAGMGLGSLEYPESAIHTSYGLVWQWTVAR